MTPSRISTVKPASHHRYRPRLETKSGALWLAVGHWNSWYDALLYMRSDNKVVLQTVLRRIILEGTQSMIDTNPSLITDTTYQPSTDGLKAATVYVATIPILCIYPFVQKYFVKGIMVGSLKG